MTKRSPPRVFFFSFSLSLSHTFSLSLSLLSPLRPISFYITNQFSYQYLCLFDSYPLFAFPHVGHLATSWADGSRGSLSPESLVCVMRSLFSLRFCFIATTLDTWDVVGSYGGVG